MSVGFICGILYHANLLWLTIVMCWVRLFLQEEWFHTLGREICTCTRVCVYLCTYRVFCIRCVKFHVVILWVMLNKNAISTNPWLWTVKSLRTFKCMILGNCPTVGGSVVCWLGVKLPTSARHCLQHGVKITRSCIDTICFSWWWAWHARNMYRTINK